MSETIKYLSQFWVCDDEECVEDSSICHKSYFKTIHFSIVNQKQKKVIHKSTPFDESFLFDNFIALGRLQQRIKTILQQKFSAISIDSVPTSQTVMAYSDIFKQVFASSNEAFETFRYLRCIQKGQQMPFVYFFDKNFCKFIISVNQRKIHKTLKSLCSLTLEEQYLHQNINFITGAVPTFLEAFIDHEYNCFTFYCDRLRQEDKSQSFNIKVYIHQRNTKKQFIIDPSYWSPQFQAFLQQKYEKNPAEEPMFNSYEYYLYFWINLPTLMMIDKNIISYFEEQFNFYKEWIEEISVIKVKPVFYCFRLWRMNYRKSLYLPLLKNGYFLETFASAFIEYVIERTNMYPEEKITQTFEQFAQSLQEYAKSIKDPFSFPQFRQYHIFRKFSLKIQQSLKNDEDVVYDKKVFLQYIWSEFVKDGVIGKGKYKKFLEKQREEEKQRERIFKEEAQILKKFLEKEEQEKFYTLLFNGYVTQARQSSKPISKQAYYIYKAQVFNQVDESYIQQEEVKYREYLQEQEQREQNEKINKAFLQNKKKKISESIDGAQKEIADEIAEEDKQNDEEEQIIDDDVCICCKGNPFGCQSADCKEMGCCTYCMLD